MYFIATVVCAVSIGCAPKKEVVELFNETHPDRHPISQSMVSNIESKYRNFGHFRDLPKSGRLENQKKINLMFCWQYRKIINQHLTNWLLISI
ncbi:hypothetical protein NQ318_012107 [Aromia moschata]|uniref:Uncharacterized protein n=1 Tax=Aromia moschata TaxID=1265417 RepID=A0AAV8YRN4_9CUCU|nr:hypothetical protein NQ318_012107 [Aromia moschata]